MEEIREEERGETQAMTLRVPREVYEALRTAAYATESSMNEIVLRSVRDFLASAGHREAVEGFLKQAQRQYRVALDKLADL